MKNSEQSFSEMVEEIKRSGDYTQEGFLLDTSEAIYKEMERRKLSKASFAKFLGISQAYLTDLLKGNRCTTIKSRAKILYKLGFEVTFKIRKIKEKE